MIEINNQWYHRGLIEIKGHHKEPQGTPVIEINNY